jgi:hypothetical protein
MNTACFINAHKDANPHRKKVQIDTPLMLLPNPEDAYLYNP